jgi:hypothetical protein
MEAFGSDGNIVANDSHVTISWTSLRGRLSAPDGAAFETIPISQIYEISVIPATSTQKGCLQLHLMGNTSSMSTELNWVSNLHEGTLTHGVMFNLPEQFQFNALTEHIRRRMYFLGKNRISEKFGTGLSSN